MPPAVIFSFIRRARRPMARGLFKQMFLFHELPIRVSSSLLIQFTTCAVPALHTRTNTAIPTMNPPIEKKLELFYRRISPTEYHLGDRLRGRSFRIIHEDGKIDFWDDLDSKRFARVHPDPPLRVEFSHWNTAEHTAKGDWIHPGSLTWYNWVVSHSDNI